ncbi:MAG TPA: energy transducer TonB [Candidatus Acidoferrum sp.]|nr:energy transducer TonB [Candidatus Acidoferrum sp.]
MASQGHFFAQFLTNSLEHYGKKLLISEHKDFDDELAAAHITAANFASPDVTAALSGKVKEDVVLGGVVTRNQKEYTLEVSAVHISDGRILYANKATVQRSDFLDSFAEHFPPEVGQKVYVTSTSEKIGRPECVACPPPPYDDLARRERVRGTTVFEVLVSPEGRAASVHPARMMGSGLDQTAFETIKRWRFRPAEDTTGNPVFVVVPIEVTFSLY